MRVPHLITALLLSASAWAQLPFSFSGSAGGDCAPQLHSEPWPGNTVPSNAVRFDWSTTNATAAPVPMQVFVYRDTYPLGGGGFVSEQLLHSFTFTAAPNTTTTGADFWPCASTEFQNALGHSVRVFGPNGTCTAFSMTVSLGTPAFANDAEGNNSFGQGLVTTLNTNYDGHLRFNGTTDDDWYKIQLPAQGKLQITLQSETPGSTATPIEAYLWYTNGTFINQWNGSTGTNQVPNTNVFEQTCVGGTGGGQYYLRLHPVGGCDISYRLTISLVSPAFATDPHPNSTPGTPVAHNTYQDGQIKFDFQSNTYDFFNLVPPYNGVMNFEVQAEHAGPVASTMTVTLMTTAGTTIQSWTVPSGANGVPITSTMSITCRSSTTDYDLRFSSAACGASYRFKYVMTPAVYANDLEPNGSAGGSTEAYDTWYEGQIGFDNQTDDDYYNLVPPFNGVMHIEILAENADATAGTVNVALHTTAGTTIQAWAIPAGANGAPQTTIVSVPCRSSTTDYDLRFSDVTCGVSYRWKYWITPAVFANDLEPNGSAGGSTEAHDTWYEGQIGFDNQTDDDYYNLVPPFNGVMNIEILAENADATAGTVNVVLHTTAGTTIQAWAIPAGANGAPQSTIVSVPCRGSTTDYDLRFSDVTCGVSYRWKYWITPALFANDAEPNNGTGQAFILPEGQTAQGHVNFDTGDNNDNYRANLSSDGVMNVTIEAEHADVSASGTIEVQLYVSSGTVLQTWTAPVGASSTSISTSFSQNCRGNGLPYYLKVSSAICGTSYRISYSVTPPVYANDPEPNNGSPGTTMDLNAANQQGHIGFYNTTDDDYYAFTHPGGAWSITLSAEHAGTGDGTMGMVVINNPGTTFGTFTVPVGGSSTALTNTFTIPSLPAGTIYRVRLFDVTCGVSYRIHCYDTDNDGTCNAFDLCAGGPEPGTPCNDNTACTTNDVIQANCSCAGTAVDPNDNNPCTLDSCDPLTGVSNVFQDTDNDGTCDANDLCPAGAEPGTACNDNDPCTTGDVIGTNCLCAGTFADADADGTCDANDLCPGGPEPGTSCNDNNGATINDIIQANCLCAGTLLGNDCNGVPGGPAFPGTACNDNNACTTGDVFDANCLCAGTFADADSDGTCDANDLCPGGPEPGTACNDNNVCTTGDVIGANCLCAGTFADADADGTCDANDLCTGGPEPGTACNDNDPCTTGDVIQAGCICAGTFQDADADGTCDANDLCPGGPEPGTACNDNNVCTTGDVIGANCLCAGTFQDADADGTCDANDLCPGGPEPGTACNDNNVNTNNDVIGANCICAGTPIGGCVTNELTLELETDGVSNTTWEVRAQVGGALVASGGQTYPNGSFNESICVPDGCYYLRVLDDNNDGITGGGYLLRTVNGKRIIDNTGNFITGGVSAILNNGGFCLPLGNDRLVTSSCDRLELRRGVNAGCSDKITADNTPNGTSGNVYQFWFFDPNGTLSLVYPSANGATSNQVSMANLPSLVDGRLYNVRVRTRISAGVWRTWGPACRMRIDNTAGQCASTQLQNEAGTQLSCGVIKPLGNGAANRVYAKPVTRFNTNCVSMAANRYQFRFRIPAEGITIVKTGVSNNPWTYLNMANVVATPIPASATLEACRTYDVEVRASFDGGATWCRGGDPYTDLAPWGNVCLLSTDGCNNQLQLLMDASASSAGHLQLYPNPNRGDQLTLGLTGIEEGAHTVGVDIHDLFGKRVSTRTIAVQSIGSGSGGTINTMLDLNGELAAGLYVVNITAGTNTFSERLVIQP